MIVGIPRETVPGERRVAMVPNGVPLLTRAGCTVLVEAGAGDGASHTDAEYVEKGARICDRPTVFAEADIILQVSGPGANPVAGAEDLASYRTGQLVVAHHDPLSTPETVRQLAERGVTAFSMEMVPRITRAQSMDSLSAMATIAGYRAVLLAAVGAPRLFPMLMTAAGTLTPTKVFVVGVGVAGLQAIATARRLGAVVSAYDVRPAVREQVQSLGAKFVEFDLDVEGAEDAGGYAREQSQEFLQRQQREMARVVAEHDVVITTAAVPGRKAPVIVTADMVRGMARGSVIVDLAAERGGNCELTQAGEEVDVDGVTVIGPVNLPSDHPVHASQMYAKNLTNLLTMLLDAGELKIDAADEIVAGTMLCRDGEVVHPQLRELLGLPGPPAQAAGQATDDHDGSAAGTEKGAS